MEVGLDYHVGIGGTRLTFGATSKLAIARACLRQPTLLIANDPWRRLIRRRKRRFFRLFCSSDVAAASLDPASRQHGGKL